VMGCANCANCANPGMHCRRRSRHGQLPYFRPFVARMAGETFRRAGLSDATSPL
jgi:hypothetical protein